MYLTESVHLILYSGPFPIRVRFSTKSQPGGLINSTRSILNHHLVSIPHPNVSVVKEATVIPLEVIVRGYLTGTTTTSSWYAYQNYDRMICGIEMPPEMKKNQKFDHVIVDTNHQA